jgi:hypothetical protein
MSARRSLKTRQADAARSILYWADGTVQGRRALVRERSDRKVLEARLAEQRYIIGKLMAARRDKTGGAE